MPPVRRQHAEKHAGMDVIKTAVKHTDTNADWKGPNTPPSLKTGAAHYSEADRQLRHPEVPFVLQLRHPEGPLDGGRDGLVLRCVRWCGVGRA